MASEPVRITVSDAGLRRSRLTVFFRLLLAIPHLIVLAVLGSVSILLLPFLWIATLATGTAPAGITGYFEALIRYSLHVNAYVFLIGARFPPIMGGEGSYEIDVVFGPAERQSRWGVGFRIVLALPALLLAGALGAGAFTGPAHVGLGALATVAFLGWFACLARGRLPAGMRDLGIYGLGYSTQAFAYVCLLTPRYPDAAPGAHPGAELPDHPVTLSAVGAELRRSRLTTLFRLPLAVPHLIWLALWGIVALVASILAWLAALVAGRVPASLHRFLAAYVRYSVHVNAFLYLTANPFPGFFGTPGSYPIEIEIGPRERQPRWTVLLRVLLALPAVLILSTLQAVQLVVAVFGWWVALCTGRMPRGLRNAGAFALRYSAQLSAYTHLLTARYPYAGPGPGPGGRALPPATPATPATPAAPAAWLQRPEAP